jgi:hypothetical protein
VGSEGREAYYQDEETFESCCSRWKHHVLEVKKVVKFFKTLVLIFIELGKK